MPDLVHDDNAIDEAIETHTHGRVFVGAPAFVIGVVATAAGAVPNPFSPFLIPAGVTLMAASAIGVGTSLVREEQLSRRGDELKRSPA